MNSNSNHWVLWTPPEQSKFLWTAKLQTGFKFSITRILPTKSGYDLQKNKIIRNFPHDSVVVSEIWDTDIYQRAGVTEVAVLEQQRRIIKNYPGEKMTKIHSYVDIVPWWTVLYCSTRLKHSSTQIQFSDSYEYFAVSLWHKTWPEPLISCHKT